MTDTMSSAGQMEMSLKDNGLIVDMSATAAASLLHHNTLASHAHALRTLKEQQLQQQQQQHHQHQQQHRHSSEEHSSCSSDNGIAEKPLSQLNTANITLSPTNLSTNSATNAAGANAVSSPPLTTFRCERCENFETNSRASLLLHVVQCLSNPMARLKHEDGETENMQHRNANTPNSGTEQHSSMNSASSTPSPAIVNGSNSNTSAANSTGGGSSSASGSRKVFECDVCNMKFSNGANMRRHKMRHTGVKPYECRVCQKRFFRKDHLAEHFTTHTKTLPYHCPICNRGFQRQIAMRAHFQNEHVGQHDLVKTCPLCSYRAGSMKSLRIHFFNRHGIDLDNPGPGGSSSLLLALESQASQVAAAAAAAGFVPTGLNAVAAAAAAAANAAAVNSNSAIVSAANQSDGGESLRSVENATPPMHFLTPHVEISTLPDNGLSDNAIFNGHNHNNNSSSLTTTTSTAAGSTTTEGCNSITGGAGGGAKDRDAVMHSPIPLTMNMPPQEHPLDCNAKSLPSSTSNNGPLTSVSPKTHHHENHITPSISLIPIKQEPPCEDNQRNSITMTNGDSMNGPNCMDASESEFSTPTTRLTSLIKVSPLKSLLREDLKRRICAKANNRITRNAASLENNNVIQSSLTPANGAAATSSTPTPICNGTITSTGPESDSGGINRKQILTCLFCGIEFPDETLYFLHKGCHCDSNPWKCNICGEQCNNVYEFNSHLLSKSHQ